MNTLCFDFGNTRLKVASFQNTKLTDVIVIDSDSLISIENLLKRFDSQRSILSSVINHSAQNITYRIIANQWHIAIRLYQREFSCVMMHRPQSHF